MPQLRIVLALVLSLAALSPAFATAEHQYKKGEYAVIQDGRAPNGRLSLAAHGDGEIGNDNFHVYLMAEPGHRRLAVLADIGSDNNLDTAPDAYHAVWSPDSRYVAVTFRSDRHVITLNLYAIDGRRARLVAGPDLFRDATSRSVDRKVDGDMRTAVPLLSWLSPRRFHLADYRIFVEDDATLAATLGPLGKASKRDDGRTTIQFSAEADGEILPDGRIRMARPVPGKFDDGE